MGRFQGVCIGPGSNCTSQKSICELCDAGTHCKRHCGCKRGLEKMFPTGIRTPKPVRSAKERALTEISNNVQRILFTPDVLKATPKNKIQNNDGPMVKTLEGICAAFPPECEVKNIPSEATRFAKNAEERLIKGNKHARNNIVNYLVQIVEKCASIILPPAVNYIMLLVVLKLSEKWKSYNSATQTTQKGKIASKIVANAIVAVKAMPPTSIPAHVIRAILVSGSSQKDLEEHFESQEPPEYKKKARKNGKADYLRMVENGKSPQVVRRKYSRVDDTIVSKMVEFILSPENVGTLSWGQNEVQIPNTTITVTLPKLTRKRTIEAMWEHYFHISSSRVAMESYMDSSRTTRAKARSRSDKNQKQRVGRTTFYKAARAITADAERMMQSVDYVCDTLVNVTTEMLQRIISDLVAPVKKKLVSQLLAIVRNFLKVQYDQHVSINDDQVPCHGIIHGLSLPTVTLPDVKKCHSCHGCMFVEWFMREKLPRAVNESHTEANTESVEDALKYIADSLEKFHIYQGHRARVLNQSTYFSEQEKEMKNNCLKFCSDCLWCIWVIDWKMKFEAKRFREASTHHYGKRGIGWHGIILVYYTYEAPNKKNQFTAQAVRHQVSLDQILGNGSKQDGFAVLSMIEAGMEQISTEIPHLRIKISSFVHTEAQDGKGLADGHFSVANKHVVRYLTTRRMNEFRTVCTPTALVDALASKNGLNNSGAQLDYVDKEKQLQLDTMLSKIADQASEFFARANEYIYFPDEDDNTTWAKMDLSNVENWGLVLFHIRVYAYSRIGSGAKFEVSFEKQSFLHIPDTTESLTLSLPDFDSIEDDTPEEDNDKEEDISIEDEFSVADIDSLDSSDDETNGGNESDGSNAEGDDQTDDEEERVMNDSNGGQDDRVYGKPNYKRPTVSGVFVGKRLTFGTIRGKQETMKKVLEAVSETDDELSPERSVVARAIAMASDSMGSENSTIRDGKSDMPEYKLAKAYTLPDSEWCREQGWARRPTRDGGMYGANYMTDKYKKDIQDLFDRGAKTSSEKMSAAEMREELESRYPGLYTYPAEHEIASYISSLVQAEKKDKKKGSSKGRCRKENPVSEDLEKKLRALIDKFPTETGSKIEARLKQQYRDNLPANYNRKIIMNRVNTLRGAAKKKAKTTKQRAVIG